jgi:hypothetical protein
MKRRGSARPTRNDAYGTRSEPLDEEEPPDTRAEGGQTGQGKKGGILGRTFPQEACRSSGRREFRLFPHNLPSNFPANFL